MLAAEIADWSNKIVDLSGSQEFERHGGCGDGGQSTERHKNDVHNTVGKVTAEITGCARERRCDS